MRRVESNSLDELLLRDERGKQSTDLLFHWPHNILFGNVINTYHDINNSLLIRRATIRGIHENN